jgi:hypothetical protein
MTDTTPTNDAHEPASERRGAFADEAGRDDPGLLREYIAFMRDHRKWWLTPLLIAMGLIGLLVLLTSTPLGAALYTLF